jgi:uncharacterized RDD family membrane protein YckC
MDQQQPAAPGPVDPPQPADAPPPAPAPAAPPPVAPAAPPPVASAPVPPAPVPPVPSSAPPSWQSGPQPVGPAPGVEFAGYGARILAYIIDGILVGVGVWVIAFLSILMGGGSELNIVSTILLGAAILLGLVYFPFFWQRTGQTPGMQALNIRVVRDRDGGPVTWGSAILRLIGYGINSIVFGIPIGWLWILFDSRRRGWHDLIGSTVVVKA